MLNATMLIKPQQSSPCQGLKGCMTLLIKKSLNQKKRCKQMQFLKNSTILRKNQIFKHVYILKSGQAVIYDQNKQDQIIHTFQEGDCLNIVQICCQINSLKTIKANKRCQIILINWTKKHQDQQKKNTLIPKYESFKFYQIPLFINNTYQLKLQLVRNFKKILTTQRQLKNLILNPFQSTFFVISGKLILENTQVVKQKQILLNNQTIQSFKRNQSHTNKNLHKKLIKIQKGEIIFIDQQLWPKINYVNISDSCQIIYINTKLLYYLLGQQQKVQIQTLRQQQKLMIINRFKQNIRAQNKVYKNRCLSSNCLRRQKFNFTNQIIQNSKIFDQTRHKYYRKTNKDFQSFSDQKTRILKQRDNGYQQITDMNNIKYAKTYKFKKKMQVNQNLNKIINSNNKFAQNNTNKNNQNLNKDHNNINNQNQNINQDLKNNNNSKDVSINNIINKNVKISRSVTAKTRVSYCQNKIIIAETQKQNNLGRYIKGAAKQSIKMRIKSQNISSHHSKLSIRKLLKQNQIENMTLNKIKALRQQFQVQQGKLYKHCKKIANQLCSGQDF